MFKDIFCEEYSIGSFLVNIDVERNIIYYKEKELSNCILYPISEIDDNFCIMKTKEENNNFLFLIENNMSFYFPEKDENEDELLEIFFHKFSKDKIFFNGFIIIDVYIKNKNIGIFNVVEESIKYKEFDPSFVSLMYSKMGGTYIFHSSLCNYRVNMEEETDMRYFTDFNLNKKLSKKAEGLLSNFSFMKKAECKNFMSIFEYLSEQVLSFKTFDEYKSIANFTISNFV